MPFNKADHTGGDTLEKGEFSSGTPGGTHSASIGFCFLACSGIKRCRISGVAPFNSARQKNIPPGQYRKFKQGNEKRTPNTTCTSGQNRKVQREGLRRDDRRPRRITLRLEVEQRGKRPAIGQAAVRVSELIKEWMHASFQLQ